MFATSTQIWFATTRKRQKAEINEDRMKKAFSGVRHIAQNGIFTNKLPKIDFMGSLKETQLLHFESLKELA